MSSSTTMMMRHTIHSFNLIKKQLFMTLSQARANRKKAIFWSFTFSNFVDSARLHLVLHHIDDIIPSFFIHSTIDDGQCEKQNNNKTIIECVIITMKETILLRNLSPWHMLGFQWRYIYRYRYVMWFYFVLSCQPPIYIIDNQRNNHRIPDCNQRLMKCNYNVKKLVNLGLAACNRCPYQIEYHKGKMVMM